MRFDPRAKATAVLGVVVLALELLTTWAPSSRGRGVVEALGALLSISGFVFVWASGFARGMTRGDRAATAVWMLPFHAFVGSAASSLGCSPAGQLRATIAGLVINAVVAWACMEAEALSDDAGR